jgi:hypothetical protein
VPAAPGKQLPPQTLPARQSFTCTAPDGGPPRVFTPFVAARLPPASGVTLAPAPPLPVPTTQPLEGADKLAGIVKGMAKPGDYVVLLGAGNITQWAAALPGELKALG